MTRTLMIAAGVAALTMFTQAGAAQAQQYDDQFGVTSTEPSQTITSEHRSPRFSLGGVPVGIDAPVATPYSNSAFRNFAGQPATGYSTLEGAGGPAD